MKDNMKFDLQGTGELDDALAKLIDSVTGPELVKGLTAGYLVWEGAAKIKIQTSPATGRKYGKHQASAPGEPPATDLGNLVNDWPPPKVKGSQTKPSIEGGPGAEYAGMLELGTSKMEARPFMRPALDESESEIALAVSNVLSKFANKAGS